MEWNPPENTFSYKIYKELCSEPAAGKSTKAAVLRELIAHSLLVPLGSAWQMTKSERANKYRLPGQPWPGSFLGRG